MEIRHLITFQTIIKIGSYTGAASQLGYTNRGKLKIVSHSEKFDPIYSHMLIKKKKWLSPTVKAFSEFVIKSIRETDNELESSR
ncbi:hypothetical protein PPOLYM_03820 [Paenibacillus polymyxa]|jgi:hypothetical protein|nr:hypothetical protein VK72_13050 [Paenibacillus polymyxa]ODB63105.1 hypothetical protein A7309_11480 [Paenibacillus polymyxa]VUG07411.1 hypothetical protein PPOLYM_03820 [Paenibacillus polymyxa]